MSTVAHPRSVPSGPSRKIVAGFLVGAALAVAVGYGVVTLGDPASGELSQPAGSDQVIAQKAAEIAAAKAAAVARGEQMQEINEIGFGNATLSGAELAARTEWMLEINETWPLPSTSSAAGFSLDGASHALPEYIRDELQRILSTPSAADFGLDGASHALPEYIRDELTARTQNAQYESQIEYLTEQWKAASISGGADQVYKQKGAELAATEEATRRGERMLEINSFGWEPAKLESGGPRSPLTVE